MGENENITFEEALAALERSVSELRNDSISLDASMEIFRNGKKMYEKCADILNDTKQQIKIFEEE